MIFALTITLRASAKAAAEILNFCEGLADGVMVQDVAPVRVQKRKAVVLPQAPVVSQPVENQFVMHAVASSTSRQARVPVVRTGRNRVVYMLVNPMPEGVVIIGVPARITQMLAGSTGMSAKHIEVTAGLKRKSVESALYHLRTIGVVRSVEV